MREAERLVKKLSAEFRLTPVPPAADKPRELLRLEEELSDRFTARVELRLKNPSRRSGGGAAQGELAIAFASLDELNGLIERLRAA